MYRQDARLVQENDQENNFTTHMMMEDLLDKLKLLNYDVEFVKELKMKPINRWVYRYFYYSVFTKPCL